MRSYVFLVGLVGLLLSGCASVIDGTSQSMVVETIPPGAECSLDRNNELLARIITPQTVNIKKTKHDIRISCEKDGFYQSTEHVNSEIQDATWGNIILGGGIGWAIDSASGADNKYADHVTLTMVPVGEEKPVAADETPAIDTDDDGLADATSEPKASVETGGGTETGQEPAQTKSTEENVSDDQPTAVQPDVEDHEDADKHEAAATEKLPDEDDATDSKALETGEEPISGL